jgi:hypothetical protein
VPESIACHSSPSHPPLHPPTPTPRYDQPRAVDEAELPLKLPDMDDFKPGDDPQGASHACVCVFVWMDTCSAYVWVRPMRVCVCVDVYM